MENKGKNKKLFLICLIIIASFFVASSFSLFINSKKDPIFLKNECVVQLDDSIYGEDSDTFTGTLRLYYIAPSWDQRTITDLYFSDKPVYTNQTSSDSNFDFSSTDQISNAYSSFVNYGAYNLKSQIFEINIIKSDFTDELYLDDAKIMMSDGTTLQVELGEIVLIDPEPQEYITNKSSSSNNNGLNERVSIINQDCILNSIDILPNNENSELKIYINGNKINEIKDIVMKKGDTISINFNNNILDFETKFISFNTFIKFNLTIGNKSNYCYDSLDLYGISQNINSVDILKYLMKVGGI